MANIGTQINKFATNTYEDVKNFVAGFYAWSRFLVLGDDEAIDKYIAGESDDVIPIGAAVEPVANHWGLFIDGELTNEYSRKADAVRGAKRRGYELVTILDNA